MTDQISGKPVLLAPDNFTPVSRTPWGGVRITRELKKGLPEERVGESWEVSLGPEFPSRAGDEWLADLVAARPDAWLGENSDDVPLVKLLDASEPLSVQIHPSDESPFLAADESGKPEAWYIVAADRGAGLYLGLRDDTTRDAFERALRDGGDLSKLMCFVPVEPGDFFVIEAGTPHAIGAGVTLVEPQRIRRKKKGVTWRYWDWNRRYDSSGRPDPGGEPRALHLEEALAVTRWDEVRGAAFLARISLRDRPDAADAQRRRLASPDGDIASEVFVIDRLSGTGSVGFPSESAFRALTVVRGEVEIGWDGGSLSVSAGRSAAIPAATAIRACRVDRALALVTSVRGRSS
jgi:mannose-6-phosphate isomerase